VEIRLTLFPSIMPELGLQDLSHSMVGTRAAAMFACRPPLVERRLEDLLLRLYDFQESGNGFKVRLLLSHLGTPVERIEMNILEGETRTPEFLARNPNGRIPLLEFEDGRRLAESNAILYFLAQGTEYWPEDPFLRAQVLQWMCFEQYSHEPYIAVLRFWTFAGQLDDYADEIPGRRKRGNDALDVMEEHLRESRFLVAARYSIADIAPYAYTHVAHEGGFDLSSRPHVGAWIDRVADRPGMLGIEDTFGG
jgi:glutathione S-transferase